MSPLSLPAGLLRRSCGVPHARGIMTSAANVSHHAHNPGHHVVEEGDLNILPAAFLGREASCLPIFHRLGNICPWHSEEMIPIRTGGEP